MSVGRACSIFSLLRSRLGSTGGCCMSRVNRGCYYKFSCADGPFAGDSPILANVKLPSICSIVDCFYSITCSKSIDFFAESFFPLTDGYDNSVIL